MPNWILNRLIITDDYLKKYKSIIESYNEVVISPIMNIITDYMFPTVAYAFEWMKEDEKRAKYQYDYRDDHDPILIDFEKIIPTGTDNSMISSKKWGTSKIAFWCKKIDNNTIEFTSAWSPPLLVIQKLSKLFSPLHFHLYVIDIEGQEYASSIEYLGNKLKTKKDYFWGSPQAEEICKICNVDTKSEGE